MAVSLIQRSRLTWLKGMADQCLTDSVQIRRTSLAPNPDGGQTETETTVATVLGRLQAQSATSAIGAERPEGGRVVAVTLWRAFLPAGTDVQPADGLLINSQRFEVVDSDRSRSDSAVVAVSLRRVD